MSVAATDPTDRASPSHQGQWELAAGVAAIVLGLVLILIVPPFRHCVGLVLHGKFGSLRHYIRSLGAGGVALLLGLMLAHAIVFYPSEIITATAAYAYGFGPGLAFVVVGWWIAALFSYGLGRTVARPLLRRILGLRFARLERGIERGGIPLLLSARLIPIVPFALVGYAAGATHTNVWRFSWTTVVGYLPLTVAVVYLGSKARTFSTSDPLVWAAVAVVVGLLAAQWIYQRRRIRRESAPGPD